MASARIELLSRPPELSSPLPRYIAAPRPTRRAMSASAGADTSSERHWASTPSLRVGRRVEQVVGDHQAEDGVTEELEPFVRREPAVLGAPGPVAERQVQERVVGEAVAQVLTERVAGVDVDRIRLGRGRSRRHLARSSGLRGLRPRSGSPTLRSPSSSSSASTSSISASESAWRSSAKESPSPMVPGSTSRMSAKRSLTSWSTSGRSIGLCCTCVSAGTMILISCLGPGGTTFDGDRRHCTRQSWSSGDRQLTKRQSACEASVDVDGLSAAVPAAVPTHDVGQLGGVAPRADAAGSRLEHPVGCPTAAALRLGGFLLGTAMGRLCAIGECDGSGISHL